MSSRPHLVGLPTYGSVGPGVVCGLSFSWRHSQGCAYKNEHRAAPQHQVMHDDRGRMRDIGDAHGGDLSISATVGLFQGSPLELCETLHLPIQGVCQVIESFGALLHRHFRTARSATVEIVLHEPFAPLFTLLFAHLFYPTIQVQRLTRISRPFPAPFSCEQSPPQGRVSRPQAHPSRADRRHDSAFRPLRHRRQACPIRTAS